MAGEVCSRRGGWEGEVAGRGGGGGRGEGGGRGGGERGGGVLLLNLVWFMAHFKN